MSFEQPNTFGKKESVAYPKLSFRDKMKLIYLQKQQDKLENIDFEKNGWGYSNKMEQPDRSLELTNNLDEKNPAEKDDELEGNSNSPPMTKDSLTLNQLKNFLNSSKLKKDKESIEHESLNEAKMKLLADEEILPSNINKREFTYNSSSDMAASIDEFYSYMEIPQSMELGKIMYSIVPDWDTLPDKDRRNAIEVWLATLETVDMARRSKAAKCLLNFAQGQPEKCFEPVQHFHRIIKANRYLASKKLGTINFYYYALKMACNRFETLTPESEGNALGSDNKDLSEANNEICLILNLFYLLVEVNRPYTDDSDERMKQAISFQDEVASLDPPLPQFLFKLIVKLKGRLFKGYPIKKILMLLARILLLLRGTAEHFKMIKDFRRMQYGLPSKPKTAQLEKPKVLPEEFSAFHNQLSYKFPSVSTSTLVDDMTLPSNSTYKSPQGFSFEFNQEEKGLNSSLAAQFLDSVYDTSRPFLLPIPKNKASQPYVPKPLDEAINLYQHNLYVPLQHVQLLQVDKNNYELPKNSQQHDIELKLDPNGFVKPLIFLSRIEDLYRDLLPDLNSTIVVLLKLLLATSSPPNNKQPSIGDSSKRFNGLDSINNTLKPPFDTPIHLSTEEVDDIRHKEIVATAVATILDQLLAQLSLSHAAKALNVGQILVDSNLPLLTLRLYGLVDLDNLTRIRNECDHLCFFKALISPKPQLNKSGERIQINGTPNQSEEKMPLLVDPSMFDIQDNESADYTLPSFELPFGKMRYVEMSALYYKVLYKVSKNHQHRISSMVQYKAMTILRNHLLLKYPKLRYYLLKLYRSMLPYLGRKWRQQNMNIITAIFLELRQGLKEDWLAPKDIPKQIETQNEAVRLLIATYHQHNYPGVVFQTTQPSSADQHLETRNQAESTNPKFIKLKDPRKARPMAPTRSSSSGGAMTLNMLNKVNGSNTNNQTYNPSKLSQSNLKSNHYSRSFSSLKQLNQAYNNSNERVGDLNVKASQDLLDLNLELDLDSMDFHNNYEAWLEAEVYNRPFDPNLHPLGWPQPTGKVNKNLGWHFTDADQNSIDNDLNNTQVVGGTSSSPNSPPLEPEDVFR